MREFTSLPFLSNDTVEDNEDEIIILQAGGRQVGKTRKLIEKAQKEMPTTLNIFDAKSKKYKPLADLTNHKWVSDRAIFNKSANKTICWFDNEKYISTNTDKIYDFRVGFGACYYKHLLKTIKLRGYSKSQLKFLERMHDSKCWKTFYEELYYLYFDYNQKSISYFEKQISKTKENKAIETNNGLPF